MIDNEYPFGEDTLIVGDVAQGMEITAIVQVDPLRQYVLRLVGGRFIREFDKDTPKDQIRVTLDASNGRADEYGDPIETLSLDLIGVRLDNSVLGDPDPGVSFHAYLRSMSFYDPDYYASDLAGDPFEGAEMAETTDMFLPVHLHYQPIYRYAFKSPDGTISEIGFTEPDSKPDGREYVYSCGGSEWKAI
ncbi:hypothetical protein [Aeromicrobium sp. 179-A 4D2 NHS]|uniref:hypothetical protein n=1 Tax=Aeromicrobium sp. 179-A 4D2 NHS TaxID=3142375 RepID=UPI0039A16802